MMLSHLFTAAFDAGIGVTEFLINWFLQSTFLIVMGLFIGGVAKNRGAALQSVIYRVTLAAILLCPLATALLATFGVSGWSLHLPAERITQNAALPSAASFKQPAFSPHEDRMLLPTADLPRRVKEGQRGLISADRTSSLNGLVVASESQINVHQSTVVPALQGGKRIDSAAAVSAPLPILLFHRLAVFCCAAWSVLASMFSIRLMSAWLKVAELRRHSLKADAEIRELCQELAASIGVQCPDVRHSPFVSSPFLAGLKHPVVMLPEADVDLRIREVLIHELAHLRRRDCDWNLILQVATSLFFFQPLIWILGRRIESTAEDVCDDYVVRFGGDRLEYASQLADAAERRLVPGLPVVVGMISFRSMLTRRVTRILDGSRTLSTRAGNFFVVIVVVVGIAVTMAAGLIGLAVRPTLACGDDVAQSKSDHQSKSDSKKEAVAQAAPETKPDNRPANFNSPSRAYRGTVVDPVGKPVKGAKVYLISFIPGSIRLLEPDWKPVTETNVQGEFRFGSDQLSAYQNLPEEVWDHSAICATAEGYGFAWSVAWLLESSGTAVRERRERAANLPEQLRDAALKVLDSIGQPMQLKADDEPVRGKILNVDGQPVAGARITLLQAHTGQDERLDEWHKKVAEERADYYSTGQALQKSINGPQVGSLIAPTLTDAEGQFVLRGIGRDRIVELLIEGPGIQSEKIYARTQPGKLIEMPNEWSRGTTRVDQYHPNQFIYVAGPSQTIVGTIVDKVTKKPIPSSMVLSQKRHGHLTNGWGQDFVRTVADSEGRFKLEGMPIGDDNRIGVIPPSGLAYVSTSKFAKTTISAVPLTVDFELQPGVWITGRVTDKHTGEGLAGRFERFTFRDNPAGERHGVDERQSMVADSQGRFRLVVAPGHGILAFTANLHEKYPRGAGAESIKDNNKSSQQERVFKTNPYYCSPSNFHLVKEIDPSMDQKEINVDLVLHTGNNLKGRVIDPSGEPIPTAAYSGKLKEFDLWNAVESDGQFEVVGYSPTEPRSLAFFDFDRSLAARFLLSGPVPNPFVVKLEPAGKAKGRIVDENGAPISDVQLINWNPAHVDSAQPTWGYNYPPPLPPGDFKRDRSDLYNDAQGRFEIYGLVPDQEYRVQVISRENNNSPRVNVFGPLDVVIKVKASQVLDLGDVRIAEPKAFYEKFKQLMKADPAAKVE